ncbi:MAG: hypothetical protein M3R40_13745 [Pseudomonadota bacterium]|nr:hypothetical protein [Pseudomonadota bacterium]
MRHKSLAPSFIAALVIGAASHAQAIPVTFNFDSVAPHDNVAEAFGLGKTGGNTEIATNMNGVLDAALGLGTSTVSVSGALATSTYNGEGHVNGDTLGTSNGGVHDAPAYTDRFIMNDDFKIYGSTAADRFSFTFTGFYIYSVSFDWEIFPDATCPASTSSTACANNPSNSNYPDIALLADGVGVWSTLASTPVSGDKDPQALGHLSTLSLAGASQLTFVDWPAEIGIDNVIIDGCTIKSPDCLRRQDVPEPAMLLLLAASALAAWGATRGGRRITWRHPK